MRQHKTKKPRNQGQKSVQDAKVIKEKQPMEQDLLVTDANIEDFGSDLFGVKRQKLPIQSSQIS